MIRVNVVAEGQSEMYFVKRLLNQYFAGTLILDSRCVQTSEHAGRKNRGGLSRYLQAKNDISLWLKQDKLAYVTTMFDFFRLPADFPGYQDALQCQDHLKAVQLLEQELKKDIWSALPDLDVAHRFIPYIQLHEFEALLFTDISALKREYLSPDDCKSIDRLYEETKDIPPEEINHGAETSPSKRLCRAIKYKKGDSPSDCLEMITIEAIRKKCPHFSQWLGQLQTLHD